MKRLFTLICLCVLAASTSWAQQVYTQFLRGTGTLTYYYDNQMSSRSGFKEVYDPANPTRRFTDYYFEVLKAVIDPSMKDAPLTSTSMMFLPSPNGYFYLNNMTTIIGLENLNTANVTDMSKMFYRCTALTSLDLSSFNTANVTDMRGMFYECQSLTSLDLSSFNTANVTNMEEMFSRCQSLTSLNLTSFKTFKVTNMSRMFAYCPNLTTIFCNNDWSISSVLESSDRMFDLCGALVGSKGTKYDSNVIDKTYARPDGGTSKPGYFTEKSAEVYTRFDEATGTLTYYYDLNMSSRLGVTELYDPVGNPEAVRFDGYNDKVHKAVIDPSMKDAPLTSMMRMFYGNQKSSELRNMETIEGLENLNTAIVTDMSQMFYGCQSLTSLGLSSFNTANVTDMTSMFYGCNALTSLDLSSFNTANVTDMSQMFSRCQYLTSLVISSFNTGNVTDMSGMFENCNDLTSLNLSSFNTANVTDMSWMFGFCASLTSLDISSFNTANVTNMNRMFTVCEKLTTIFCDDDWSTSSVLIDSEDMFDGCFVLAGGKGTKYDSNVTDKTYARPDGGTSKPGYFTRKSAEPESEVYTEFVKETGTLTYYYDTNRSSRTGVTEVYDPVGNPNAVRFADYNYEVLKAVIDPSMKAAPLTSMRNMFYGSNYFDTVYNLVGMDAIEGLENLNTAIVTDMSQMFRGCQDLNSLDLSSFNTANVTNMFGMFYDCRVSSLDLSSFNTANVTDMGCMFRYCTELTSLDLSSFNTANVMDMAGMFQSCNDLTSLDLSSFNTAKVTDMSWMFSFCRSLTSLDLTSFNTDKVTSMEYMFKSCEKLMTIICNDDWSTSSVLEYSEDMFDGCEVLAGGKGTKYDSNFTDKTYARPDGGTSQPGYFTEKSAEPKLEVYTEFVEATGTLTYYYDMDRYSRSGITKVYNQDYGLSISYDSDVLKVVIDPSMKEAPLTSMSRMFSNLESMTSIQSLENLNTANVTNMSEMFKGCSALTSLDLSSFNTANVTNMSLMFQDCSALTSLDLSSFNTAKVTNMSYMFSDCSALTSLNLSSFNTASVTDMSYMFYDCSALKSLDLSSFNTEKVEYMREMFDGCSALTSLDLSSFNTENVTNMGDMFYDCSALMSLDLSSFNTENVTSMIRIFDNCSNLKVIFCNYDWSTSSVLEYSSDMFENCNALEGGKGTKFDANVTDVTYARPDGGTSKPGYFTEKTAEVYTEFAEATGTLTFYYDTKRDSRSGVTEVYDPAGHPDAVRFTGYNKQVLKAVIDPSMKDAPLTSMKDMFYGGMNTETYQFLTLSNMTAIEGMENLNTANATSMNNMFGLCQSLTAIDLSSFNTENVTDMEGMFMGCYKLQTLDVSTFNVSNVSNMSMMFGSCMELTTIYCNSDWSIIAKSDNMFSGCTKLVGGQGTTFDSSVTNADYARPDYGFPQRGYFTRIAIRCPDGLATETYAFKGCNVYYSEDEFSEVQIGFADATTVYIQGLSKVLPEAWLKGTLIGNTLAIPETFMGIHRETDGSWYEDYEIMFLGTTFTYDSEAGTFTSSYYATNDGYDLADEYSDVTLTKLADFAATPADPEITWFYYLDSKDPSIGFNIPTVDTEGNPLITKKMAYVILYMDGEGVSPLVLTKDLYPELEADRTEQPITNYVTRQEGIYRSSLNLKQSEKEVDSWRMVGIQTVYYGGGERRTSKIVWYTNPTADGIDDINGQWSMANGQSIYNLAGQMVNGKWSNGKLPKGINIIGGRKILVK